MKHMLRLPFILALVLFPAIAVGQSTKAQRDSLRVMVSAMKLAMARVDSSGPSGKAVEARMELAAMLKDKEAVPLLDAAAALSDSLNDAGLEGMARVALSKRLSAMGNHKRANAELLRALELGEEADDANNERQAREAAEWTASHVHERDSLIASHDHALSSASDEIATARQETIEREWMLLGLAVVAAVCIVVLLLVLRRSHRRALRSVNDEVEGFRTRLSEMANAMESLAGKLKEHAPVPVAPASAPPPIAKPEAAALRLPDDPMVSALFRRQAPERLLAFQDARARGDLDKAVRVVHTLKPVLASIDANRFTGLCARLVAPGAAGTAAWNADADALSGLIEALLAQR